MHTYAIYTLKNDQIVKLHIQLPERLSEITLAQFLAISRIKAQEDANYMKDVLRVLTALLDDVILDMKPQHIQEMYEGLAWLENIKLNTDGPTVPVSFRYRRKTYYLPSGDDIGTNTYAELEDAKIAIANHKDDAFEAIPKLLAIYCRPKVGKWWMPEFMRIRAGYKSSEAKARAALFMGLDMQTAMNCACFFLARLQPLLNVLRGSTQESSTPKKNTVQELNGSKPMEHSVR